MTDAIVEVRDYTIDRAWFAAYSEWADRLAAPWLRANLDVVDFWLDSGIAPEVSGAAPRPSEHGLPNVCWIIRWPSKAVRDEQLGKVLGSPEWRAIWAKHPNPSAYLERGVRFMRAAPR